MGRCIFVYLGWEIIRDWLDISIQHTLVQLRVKCHREGMYKTPNPRCLKIKKLLTIQKALALRQIPEIRKYTV